MLCSLCSLGLHAANRASRDTSDCPSESPATLSGTRLPLGTLLQLPVLQEFSAFKEGSLVPLAPTQNPTLLLLFCSICRAAQPGSTGRAGRQDRAGHSTADTAKAKGTTRTNSTWLGHKVPAAAQLKSHLLLSAKQGPALEFSRGAGPSPALKEDLSLRTYSIKRGLPGKTCALLLLKIGPCDGKDTGPAAGSYKGNETQVSLECARVKVL